MMCRLVFFLRNVSKSGFNVSIAGFNVGPPSRCYSATLRQGNWKIDDVVVDVTVRHDFTGDARDVRRHGTLRNPDRPDQLLCEQKQQRGAGLWDEVCSPNYIRRCSGGLCSLLRICM